MTLSERIRLLREDFGNEVTAALLGVTPEEIYEHSLHPENLPDIPSGGAPLDGENVWTATQTFEDVWINNKLLFDGDADIYIEKGATANSMNIQADNVHFPHGDWDLGASGNAGVFVIDDGAGIMGLYNHLHLTFGGKLGFSTNAAAGDTLISRAAAGVVQIEQNGGGLRLKSPDGLTTKTLTIDDAGALALL